ETSSTYKTVVIFSDSGHNARIFRSFGHQPPTTREALFFERLATLYVSTVYPLHLYVFRQPPGILPDSRRRRFLEILESWLVRRTLCRLTVKNYNRYFLDLLKVVKADVARADELLILELKTAKGETNL